MQNGLFCGGQLPELSEVITGAQRTFTICKTIHSHLRAFIEPLFKESSEDSAKSSKKDRVCSDFDQISSSGMTQ